MKDPFQKTKPVELTDESLMPFGKYKGIPMKKVPAEYLFWYWGKAENDMRCPVANYIRRNVRVLASEYTNGIW